jgi:hypothetical protein
MADEASRKSRYRLVIEGKDRKFCEAVVSNARRLHPTGEYRSLEPILAWQELLAIPGVAEPRWIELDPTRHEDLFAKLYALYEDQDNRNVWAFGNLNRLDTFFARARYLCQICRLPRDERRQTTLEGYREFAGNGGRLRAFSLDIGETGSPIPVALVQYEYRVPPSWTTSYAGWYGLSFYSDPGWKETVGFSKNFVDAGRNKRAILYRGRPYILTLEDISITTVQHASWPFSECRILRSPVDAQP